MKEEAKMSRITEEFKKICLNNSQTAFYYIENKRLKSKTFQKVYEEVNAIANNLLELGVKKGDRIFALAPSNYRLCLFIMGAFKIGASLMYIDLFAKQDKVNNLFGLDKKIDIKCNKCGGKFSTFFRFTSEFFRPTNI